MQSTCETWTFDVARTKRTTYILVLDDHNPERELDFEIEFQLSLSAAQRYRNMNRLVKAGLKIMKRNGYKTSPAITTRQ
jgi:hypothetical protein